MKTRIKVVPYNSSRHGSPFKHKYIAQWKGLFGWHDIDYGFSLETAQMYIDDFLAKFNPPVYLKYPEDQ